MYIDSHCHLTDLRISEFDQIQMINQSITKNISLFLQAGVDPADWIRQQQLKEKYPKNTLCSFGLHPYFIADHCIEDCELALDELAKIISKGQGLGETGLDFREKVISGKSDGDENFQKAKQITFFENQIALAKISDQPIILHLVQSHQEALQVFNVWGVPGRQGMVHAFNGSYEVAKKYIDLGFLISIGGAVTFERHQKLIDCVKKIPIESLLLESDSPDQPPLNWLGLNNPSSLWAVADKVGQIKGISAEKTLEISTKNFKRLFSI